MSEPQRKKASAETPVPGLIVPVESTGGPHIPAGADALVLVSPFTSPIEDPTLAFLNTAVAEATEVDAHAKKDSTLVVNPGCPGRRLVISPTGPLNRDYDDVRRYADAAKAGTDRAIKAGARKPLLVVIPPSSAPHPHENLFTKAVEVAALAALEVSYQPLEVREDANITTTPLDALFLYNVDNTTLQTIVAIETGRAVARDICGSDPERMTAYRVADYVSALFESSCIKVSIEKDLAVLAKSYPLLMAVARCSLSVDRHRPCVIDLEYDGTDGSDASPTRTLYLVGKGITYDTGGADIKAGGIMAGMHRDKGGAAVVAGIFATLMTLRPKGIKVVGKLAMVRNSVGANSYVSDEIIRSRCGVRVRIGNTDAEGRLVMADLLSTCREHALATHAPNPQIITLATLTGHVGRCYGNAYTAVVPNGPARVRGVEKEIQQNGGLWADPFEISTMRREDFEFIKSKYSTEDCLQANTVASTMTGRGHQYPAAFLTVASGLDKCGLDGETPLPYAHLDIAASTRDWPNTVSAAPIPALVATYVLPHC